MPFVQSAHVETVRRLTPRALSTLEANEQCLGLDPAQCGSWVLGDKHHQAFQPAEWSML